MAKAYTPKRKKKKKHEWTGKPGFMWAVKGARVPKRLGWMPDEVVLHLVGDPDAKALELCGWGADTGGAEDPWPVDRLKANHDRISDIWEEDWGRGWRIEIR